MYPLMVGRKKITLGMESTNIARQDVYEFPEKVAMAPTTC